MARSAVGRTGGGNCANRCWRTITSNTANGLLIAAWILWTLSIFVLPFVAKLDIIPRLLWTALIAAVTGLGLYQLKWPDPVAVIETSAKSSANPSAIPSILSLFMTDFKGKGSGGGISLSSDGRDDLTLKNDVKLRIFFQINEDYGNRSKFLSFYIQSSPHTYEAIEFLATRYRKYLNATPNMEEGGGASSSVTKTSELVFTGRVFIYYEDTLSLSELGKLSDLHQSNGLSPQFLTTPYALTVWQGLRSGSGKHPAKYELRDGIPRKVAE